MPEALNQPIKPAFGRGFTQPAAFSGIPISLFGCLVFFFILWLLDFPKPYLDDLSYIGAALNMANGGDFSNPFLSRQFSEHFAFYYPPIHSYVLAGWLKVFGISTASLTAFQMVAYSFCAGSAIFILRRHQSPVWVEWLIPLAVTNAFLTHGLRPEPLAAAFVMVGFAMIECGVRNRILVFFAFLLMFLGGGAAPRMTLYAAALIMVSVWRIGTPAAKDNRERWVPLGLAAAAGMLAVIIFLTMIGFKFLAFWENFHLHSQFIATDTLVVYILKRLSCIEEILWLLVAIALLFVLWRRPKDDLTRLCIILLPIVPIEILTKLTAHGASLWYTLLICLFLSASLWKQTSAFWKRVLPIGLVLAMIFFNSEIVFNVIGRVTGRIQETKKLQLPPAPAQGHTVFVDYAAVRYYYDYRLPKSSIDFYFSVPFPMGTPLEGIADPTDVYLVGPDNVDFLKEYGGLDYPSAEKWSPVGFSRLSFYKYPRQTFVITPDLCKKIMMRSTTDRHGP